MFENEEVYLAALYGAWQQHQQGNVQPLQALIGTLPPGYDYSCPPIPRIGERDSRLTVVSLEPKLDLANYNEQVELANTFEGWHHLYFFSEYYSQFYTINQNMLSGYWKRIGYLAVGFAGNNNNVGQFERLTDHNLTAALAATAVEYPYIQIHATNHGRVPPSQILATDFLRRIDFKEVEEPIKLYFNSVSSWQMLCPFVQYKELPNNLIAIIEVQTLTDKLQEAPISIYTFNWHRKQYVAFVAHQFSSRQFNLSYVEIQELGRVISLYNYN